LLYVLVILPELTNIWKFKEQLYYTVTLFEPL
jgi:hypothetical protein